MAENDKIIQMGASHLVAAAEKLSAGGIMPGMIHRLRTDSTYLQRVISAMKAEDRKFSRKVSVAVNYTNVDFSKLPPGVTKDFRTAVWKDMVAQYLDSQHPLYLTQEMGIVRPDCEEQDTGAMLNTLYRRDMLALSLAELWHWLRKAAYDKKMQEDLARYRYVINPAICGEAKYGLRQHFGMLRVQWSTTDGLCLSLDQTDECKSTAIGILAKRSKHV